MTKIKIAFILTLILSSQAFGQTGDGIEMADVLRQDGKIYTVVFGLAVILTGMIIFLIRVDRKIFNLEKRIEERESL